MAEPTRAEREEKVIEQIREWLPELGERRASISITCADDGRDDGAMFKVESQRMFVCRRGGDS